MLERSHFDGCPLNELLELVGGTSTSQTLPKAVRQQRRFRVEVILANPLTQSPLRLRPERKRTLLASLAQHLNLLATGPDVHHAHGQHFGDARACII